MKSALGLNASLFALNSSTNDPHFGIQIENYRLELGIGLIDLLLELAL